MFAVPCSYLPYPLISKLHAKGFVTYATILHSRLHWIILEQEKKHTLRLVSCEASFGSSVRSFWLRSRLSSDNIFQMLAGRAVSLFAAMFR